MTVRMRHDAATRVDGQPTGGVRPRGVSVRLLMIALTCLLATSCGDGNATDPSTGPTTGAASDPVCDFVDREALLAALGGDEVDVVSGGVHRDPDGSVTGAGCVGTTGSGEEAGFTVEVVAMMGQDRRGFERGLADPSLSQLPEGDGLGFVTDGATLSPYDVPAAWLGRGDFLVRVQLRSPLDRDTGQDAMAIARQVADSLDIPDTWTLSGRPPARP